MASLEKITKAICTADNIHLACSFPECGCVSAPRQAIAALAASLEWQPIETVLKSLKIGDDFLAACQFQKKHHQMVGCIAPDGKFHSWPGRYRYDPAHWMPIPEPPK